MDADLKSMTVFVTVAETRSFRAAADRLGVTRSAVSQAVNGMEARLGIALFHRTTRSVNLTEAGRQLHRAAAPAMAEIAEALRSAVDLRDRPMGQLRLAVSSIAEGFLSGPLHASISERFPDIRIDIVVTDVDSDIVDEG